MSLTILGDSIAVGVGERLGGGKTVAKIGAFPKTIASWPFEPTDWLVISMGSNGNDAAGMSDLRAALAAVVAKAPNAKCIFILPNQDPARTAVLMFAAAHGNRTVGFTAGGDGVHPQNYHPVADAVLAIMRGEAPQTVAQTPVAKIAAQFDPLMKSLIGGQDIHRCAVWGQTKQESLGNPAAIERPGTNLGGIGLWQHTGPRRRALEAYAAQRGKPWQDAETQVRFMCSELLGPEAHSWAQTQKTTTIEAATETFLVLNERAAPATANLPRRIAGAKEALAAIQAAQHGERKMTDTSGVTAAAPSQPVDQLAAFIKRQELAAEDVLKAFVMARFPFIPGFALDLLFNEVNKIDLVSMAEHVDWGAVIGKVFQKTA